MDEPTHLAAQAADVLISLGFPVRPHGPDMGQWIIGDLVWTDEELMELAAHQWVQALTGAGQALIERLQ